MPRQSADVPRPALEIWQPLESEHIRWEGQVAIVGQHADLPALLVITGKRLALIANNEIALEFPLGWMRPAPRLMTENGIRVYVSPQGDTQIAQPMLLRAKAGRGAAIEIERVLTGRSIGSRDQQSPLHIPKWNERVSAAPSVALPQLHDDSRQAPTSAAKPAWPPAETAGVHKSAVPQSPTPPTTRPMAGIVNNRPKPSADTAPWKVGSKVESPAPVPATMSRAQRLLGTSTDGFTVSDDPQRLPVPTAPARASERKHSLPFWLLNLTVVLLLLAGFAYVANDRGIGVDTLRTAVPGSITRFLGIEELPPSNGDVAQAPGQGELSATDVPVDQGGDNRILPVKNTTSATETATEAAVADSNEDSRENIGGASTRLPIAASLSTPGADDTATEAATEEATEDVATETEVATEVATEEAATEEATNEDIATETPTEEIATEQATDVLPTEVPTEPATVAPDPTMPQPTPEPTVAPTQSVQQEQPASVAEGSLPTQQFADGGIRYSIAAVETGTSVPSLPEVNNIGQTWVIITLDGSNTSSTDQEFSMANFTLLADGNPIPLDTGTGWVSSLLGNAPAYGATDTATWIPGEQHQFTLTFLAPPNASNLVLQAGDQQIALDPAITTSVALREVPKDQAPAAIVSGTVVDVIDGQTIVVDLNGELITVRYLGIDAPTGEACYAEQSTAANAELVEGQTVQLERQSADTTARGVWVRDVWVTDANGNQVLVSQALVSEGAARSKITEPNSRYAGWLNTSQQDAENNGAGMYRLCGQ